MRRIKHLPHEAAPNGNSPSPMPEAVPYSRQTVASVILSNGRGASNRCIRDEGEAEGLLRPPILKDAAVEKIPADETLNVLGVVELFRCDDEDAGDDERTALPGDESKADFVTVNEVRGVRGGRGSENWHSPYGFDAERPQNGSDKARGIGASVDDSADRLRRGHWLALPDERLPEAMADLDEEANHGPVSGDFSCQEGH